MSEIPEKEYKILIANSGGKCAFPKCGKPAVTSDASQDTHSFTHQASHIIGQSRQGPRGSAPISEEERNSHKNLILFCQAHHKLVDDNPRIYSVSVLREIKRSHEAKFAQDNQDAATQKLVKDTVHSTCLAVSHMPGLIYSAQCRFSQGEEKEVRDRRNFDGYDGSTPFFLNDGKLFSFCDLTDANNPFRDVIDRNKIESHDVKQLNLTLDGFNKISRLFNTAMRQKLGPKNIAFDKDHHRYHFRSDNGKPQTFYYLSPTGRHTTRNVAWQPVTKSTGQPKKHWLHLAAGINLRRVGDQSWIITIRPERHLTTDGTTPLTGKTVGKRVTSLKARMFNDKYLDEVLLWRYVLCEGSPNITFSFGKQSLLAEAKLLQVGIEWPGIVEDKKAFTNQVFEDDLFSVAERRNIEDGEEEDDGITE